jgi:hypothetical protein
VGRDLARTSDRLPCASCCEKPFECRGACSGSSPRLTCARGYQSRLRLYGRRSSSSPLSLCAALVVDSSLTVFARGRKHRVDHKCWEGKQPRNAPMKRFLISAACVIFIFGTAQPREVAASPSSIPHETAVAAARRLAQLYSAARESLAPCATAYIATMRSDGSSYTRKSVDCEE